MSTVSKSRVFKPGIKLGQMLNKVPEIVLFFWIIKILCTTVGETAADFLNTNLKFGLTNTTYIMGAFLAIALFAQFKQKKYIPGIYWLVVVLLSVFGTLVTDNLTDNFSVSLITTTVVFSIGLAATFFAWNTSEKTLSIHSITSTKREAFYWLSIFFTFALGTAAGDLVAEKLNLGYLLTTIMFAGIIVAIALAHNKFKLNSVLAFWMAYIITRPLGASLGDLLSQDRDAGGIGLGSVVTSILFLSAILAVVIYLTQSRRDEISLKNTTDKE